MTDWTNTRLNLRYRWKTVLIWGIGIVGACVVALWSGRADAWVQDYQPFPDGNAPVVVHRFCRGPACGSLSQRDWQQTIRSVVAEWNNTGSAFMFEERGLRNTDDPCRLPGAVAVIVTDPASLCPGDGPLRYNARTEFGGRQARVYINATTRSARSLSSLRRMLLHEFGHVAGLNHPDAAGQNVTAVMNGTVYYDHLQADDIAGIQALYPASEALAGLLENPGDGSSRSGIGIISGWVCEANEVTIELSGDFYKQVWKAAYGTNRPDTWDVCGDGNNGFGLLFNWNRLGDGKHRVVALVDGVELGRATVTVTTLGEEFLRGAKGEYVLEDFPSPGRSVVIEWEESLQNFVIRPSGDEPEEPQECQYPEIPGACGDDG